MVFIRKGFVDRTNLRKTVNKGVKLIDEGNSYQAENESMRDTNNISHPSFRNKPKGISNIPFRPNSTTRQISFDSEERHSQRRLDSARVFKKSFGKINFKRTDSIKLLKNDKSLPDIKTARTRYK